MAYDLKKEEDVEAYIKNLGTEYRFGCFQEKNPEVCHLLGDYLESIVKDFHKAAKIFLSNCDDYKFPQSCYKAANYYLSGKGGLQQSNDKAIDYYEKGCELKDINSCFRSGVLSILNCRSPKPTRDFMSGVKRLTQGCAGDHADSCHHLSAIYMDGEEKAKLAKDMAKAFQFAVKACDLGNLFACVNVSIMYKRGEGVEQNTLESEKYKKKAIQLKEEFDQKRQLIFQEGLKPA